MEANQAFLRAVFANTEEMKVDWAEVQKDTGMSRKDHTREKFVNIMKKIGLKYKDNSFTPIEGYEPDAPAAATTPKSRGRKKQDKAKGDGASVTAVVDGGGDGAGTADGNGVADGTVDTPTKSPKKKRKVAKEPSEDEKSQEE